MPTVFVVQEMPNHDIAPAMRFGEMKVLLPSNTQIAFSTIPTVRTLRRKLRDYKDEDFLLLTGDPVAIGLACSIDRKSTRLNSSHIPLSRMPSSA